MTEVLEKYLPTIPESKNFPGNNCIVPKGPLYTLLSVALYYLICVAGPYNPLLKQYCTEKQKNVQGDFFCTV